MSFNLLNAAKGLITNELISKASSYLGESKTGVTKAMEGILPSIVGGIIDKASSHEGANMVTKLATEAHTTGFLNNLDGFFGNDSGGGLLNKGAGLLSSLFGDNKAGSLMSLIANFSGIKNSSATSLLSMAAPMVLGLLGKHITSENVNGVGVSNLLSSQKTSLLSSVPSGLNLHGLFNGLSEKISFVPNSVASTATNDLKVSGAKPGMGLKWLLPLLLLALAALIAWYLLGKGCNSESTVGDTIDSLKSTTEQTVNNVAHSVTGKLDSLTNDWIYDGGKNVTIDLPNGAGKLEVGENSTENKLYTFLIDKDQKVDTAKGNWFEFTNVHFKTSGTELDSTSIAQLRNMVAITKAFPTAEFKLGGYTDNTGDSVLNINLSQKRAEVVADQLKKLGAAASAITGTKGYGPQWPLQDNATAEGRAQNRRVAVNVKAK